MLQWTWGCIYPIKSVFSYFSEVELLEHMVVLFLIFLRKLHTIFHSDCTNLLSLRTVQKDSFSSHPRQHFIISCLFDDSLSERYNMGYHCGFDLHFSDSVMLSIFSCAYWLSVCNLWQNTPSDCLPVFLNTVGFLFLFLFFCCWVIWVLHIF